MWCNEIKARDIAALLLIGLCSPKVRATPLIVQSVTTMVTEPVFVTHAPCDFERIFIVEQDGRIKVLDLGSAVPTIFLDITSRTSKGGERGLLGLAFHPDYQDNGFFYVNYTNTSGNTVVAEYEVTANPDVADFSSERILLTITQPFSNHNGGWMAFGPNDGYLYIATGDGGAGGDPGNRAQNINDLLGKMLRIDVNIVPYGIPPDNPFVGVAGLDEIWAYGLRNPWRNAFDTATGDLYIADVGQGAWEEISFQSASSTGGENWGWRCREGAHNFDFSGNCGVSGTPSEFLLDPIHEYPHGAPDFHCSISGGEVYRGCAIPDLRGTYFFADYCSGNIWSFEYTGAAPVVTNRTAELTDGGAINIVSVSSFGRDAYGEIYICDLAGVVYKIVPDNVASACSTFVSPPLEAPYPHDRRKNRYLSFDPNFDGNKGLSVAFKVELKELTLGSCDGNGGFCREDRGGDDCKACSIDTNPCITQAIDCAPNPPQTCNPTGETCINDAPDAGGTSVGSVWWVGPESPLNNSVHLLVTQPFRKVSACWPNPTHAGDCEVVPEAVYGVRAVNLDGPVESAELEVETALYAAISASWWGDCVGPLKKFCGGDITTPECAGDTDCDAPETCDFAWTLPEGSVNFDDVGAALALVAPGPGSTQPHMTWVDLHGNGSGVSGSHNYDPPNFVANFSDIGQVIFSFQGRPYTFFDPADCPDVGTWP